MSGDQVTLPTNIEDFLIMVIRDWVFLGVVTAFILENVFNYWNSRSKSKGKGEIEPHDKGLISIISPSIVALLAYFVLCAVDDRVSLSVRDTAQAVYVGVKAAIGAQGAYFIYKKYIATQDATTQIITNTTTTTNSTTNSNTTNIDEVKSDADVHIGGEHTITTIESTSVPIADAERNEGER